jgi:hypothetical protein
VRRPGKAGLILFAAWLAVPPPPAAAQACVGSPAEPGQFAVGGQVGLAEGSTAFAMTARMNRQTPLAVGLVFGVIDVDELDRNITVTGVDVAWELPVEGFSACPITGLGYGTWSDSAEAAPTRLVEVTIPIGLSLGARVREEGSLVLLPSIEGGLLHSWIQGTFTEQGVRLVNSDSETGLFGAAGLSLVFGQLFARASLSGTTLQGSGRVIQLRAGIVF